MSNLSHPFTQVFLPLVVVFVMFALGSTLTATDFKRLLRGPRGLVVGLLAHTVVLPLLAFGVAMMMPLSPPMAIGLVLIASCPANASVNLFTFLARGDTMLSVALTAVASIGSVISIPVFLNLALQTFPSGRGAASVPVLPAALALFLVATVPVVAGMVLRQRRPRLAQALGAGMGRFGLVVIALVMVGAIWTAQSDILPALLNMGLPVLLLNISSVAIAWGLAVGARLPRAQCIAVGFECGLQNFALAAFVALTILQDSELMVPAIAYGLTMWVSAFALLLLARRSLKSAPVPAFD